MDMEMARREAQELYQAGEQKWGTDESKFNQIIAVRSFPQLRATFDEYVKVSVCVCVCHGVPTLESTERPLSVTLVNPPFVDIPA